MLKSFYHTGFVVKSLEESVKFYTETLGLNLKRPMFETGGDLTEQVTGLKGVRMKVAFLDLSNEHHLELIEYVYPPRRDGSPYQDQRPGSSQRASHEVDWAHVIKKLVDEDYPDRDRIVLVMDKSQHSQAVLAIRGIRAC